MITFSPCEMVFTWLIFAAGGKVGLKQEKKEDKNKRENYNVSRCYFQVIVLFVLLLFIVSG